MPSPNGPTRRPRLNRAAVVRAAVDLADAEGMEVVSMRRLADGLGVVPMALYKHVADKEDLLDGMVDQVVGEFPAQAASGPAAREATDGRATDGRPTDGRATDGEAGWEEAVRRQVWAARAVMGRHPWARRAVETRARRTPAVLAHMERVAQALLGGGLGPDLTHHAMHALGNRIWGFSPELFDESRARPDRGPRPDAERAAAPDPANYPGIVAIAADAAARRPGATGCDEDFEFGFALDVVLDGIGRRHRAGWASPTSTGATRGPATG